MIGTYRRPVRRRMLRLTVRNRTQVSPHFVSVTLGGPDVQHLEQSLYDQNGRLFFPAHGQDEVVIPNSEKWMRQLLLTPAAKRPRVRFYSIRRFRPSMLEFDIEVVIHGGDTGVATTPGARWALDAEPGDQVGFLDEGGVYGPPANAGWQLLVGDESALPPILAILEQTAEKLPAEVFLEVPATDDIRDVTTPAGTTIHWLPRNDSTLKPGTLALKAVAAARMPAGPYYTWTAGESALPTGVRRHLITDRSVPRSDIAFLGYWKHGTASLG